MGAPCSWRVLLGQSHNQKEPPPCVPQGQCLFEQCAFPDALKVFSQASMLQPEKASFRYRW